MDPHLEPREGLRDEYPRPTGVGLATALGGLWGFLGYTILWEGAPLQVHRPFVQSLAGTLALLPVRAVIWAIHVAELGAGRTFDLSSTHWWIAPAASLVGAVIALVVFLAGRTLARRTRARGGT